MKKIILICLLLVSVTACKKQKNEEATPTEQNKTSHSTNDSTSTKLTTSTATTVNSTTEQSTKEVMSDPKEIYSSLKGEWLSKEIDGNNVQWQAIFTADSATIGPLSGVENTLSFQITSLDWDSENQRLTIAVAAYDPNGTRSPENDYVLAVHDIDFTNFSQMTVFGTNFATTDMTYYRK
ncbi:hypothetical protein ACYSNW_14910 [Enterococcus sp. LJL99]